MLLSLSSPARRGKKSQKLPSAVEGGFIGIVFRSMDKVLVDRGRCFNNEKALLDFQKYN